MAENEQFQKVNLYKEIFIFLTCVLFLKTRFLTFLTWTRNFDFLSESKSTSCIQHFRLQRKFNIGLWLYSTCFNGDRALQSFDFCEKMLVLGVGELVSESSGMTTVIQELVKPCSNLNPLIKKELRWKLGEIGLGQAYDVFESQTRIVCM